MATLATFASRLGRIIGLLGLAAALAGCSAIKLGYNNIDEVAYWWLDAYVDLSEDQSARVREDLERLHRWHRSAELPQLVTLLQAMEQVAPADVTAAQSCAVVAQLRQRVDAIANRAEPAIVTLVTGLAPEQIAHLERKYAKNNADFSKEWRLSPSEIMDKRFAKFVERSEMVYGTLDEPQRALVRRLLQRSVFDAGRVLADRQRRQRDALQTARKMTAPATTLGEARTLLRGYLDRVREPPDAAARAYQHSLIDEACANFAALHNSTSPAQREAAVRRLRAYQRDLRELSAQP